MYEGRDKDYYNMKMMFGKYVIILKLCELKVIFFKYLNLDFCFY